MPNELDGEEGMFVGYYDRLYTQENEETKLPYVDDTTKIDENRIKSVIYRYLKDKEKKDA